MNIFETQIEAEKPQGVTSQSQLIYVPEVTSTTAGIAKFDCDVDFIISQGKVFLNKLNELNGISYDNSHLVKAGVIKKYVDDIQIDIDADILQIQSRLTNLENSTNTIVNNISVINNKITDIQLELENKADKSYFDNNFVTLNTNQNITGTKTFSTVEIQNQILTNRLKLFVQNENESDYIEMYHDNNSKGIISVKTVNRISPSTPEVNTLFTPNEIIRFKNENHFTYNFPDSSGTFALNGDIGYLNEKIDAIQGKGGYLLPYNFGTATPSETQLNNYALTQITNIDDPTDIFNGTRVTNKYDNHTWLLNNTPDTNPAVFEWVDLGFEYASIATNNNLGIVKGSNTNLKVTIDSDGEMSVNGLNSQLQSISTDISTLDDDINNVSTGLKTRVSEIEDELSQFQIDSQLSSVSENAVQNKVIYNYLLTKQNTLTTASVNDGTIDKIIGFDTNGNLVKALLDASGVEFVTYGDSTVSLQSITNLVNAGKLVVCYNPNANGVNSPKFAYLQNLSQYEAVFFGFKTNGDIFIYIRSSYWATNSYALQSRLVSGQSIKTINGNSLLSSGNLSVQARNLVFTDTIVSNWTSDNTYSDYGYKATISLTGVTADMIPDVIFGANDVISGNYLSIAESYNGGIYIYSKVNDSITIPTIVIQKVGD